MGRMAQRCISNFDIQKYAPLVMRIYCGNTASFSAQIVAVKQACGASIVGVRLGPRLA
jgi:hypothetical protein